MNYDAIFPHSTTATQIKYKRERESESINLTISLGDDAACMNQSCVRKSFIGFFSDELACGHCVPGKRRIKPLVAPKYCQESAASRSKLFANIGSKCADHATDDCTLESGQGNKV